MSRFLKLSHTIINVSHIKEITIRETKYTIYLQSNKHSGFSIAGSGFISNDNDHYTICKNNDPEDYNKIDQWIKKMPDYL